MMMIYEVEEVSTGKFREIVTNRKRRRGGVKIFEDKKFVKWDIGGVDKTPVWVHYTSVLDSWILSSMAQ